MQWLIVFIKESARFDPSAIVKPCCILTVGICKLIQLAWMSAWWTIKYNLLNSFFSFFSCAFYSGVWAFVVRDDWLLVMRSWLMCFFSFESLPYRCSRDSSIFTLNKATSSCGFWSQARGAPNKVQQVCIVHATPDLFLSSHMLWFALT